MHLGVHLIHLMSVLKNQHICYFRSYFYSLILCQVLILGRNLKDNKMAIQDLLSNGANVSITVSAEDLRTFFAEVAQQVINQEKAAQAAKNDVEMLNQAQVCSYLGVSKATVWRWEKIGYLRPSTRMGSRPMYNKTDVERIKKGE